MSSFTRSVLTLLCLSFLGISCGLIDSGIEWRDGRYALIWIDDPNEISLDLQTSPDGWPPLVDKRVFAVGSDQRYIVAKQHPSGDRFTTNFFVIDKSKDEFHCVQGPMTESDFLRLNAGLHLPQFTRTLDSIQ